MSSVAPEGIPTVGRTVPSRREAGFPVGCFRRTYKAQGVGIAQNCWVGLHGPIQPGVPGARGPLWPWSCLRPAIPAPSVQAAGDNSPEMVQAS